MTGIVEDDIDFSFKILGKWCCTERKYRKKAYHTVCVCVCVCVHNTGGLHYFMHLFVI